MAPAGAAAAGPAPGLRVRLLGGFEVWHGDQPVGGFESQKVRALLAYLVSHPDRGFSRESLAGLLWPDRDPESARHALRQAVYNMKASLPDNSPGEPPILSDHLGLRFNARSGVWVDVAAFEDALRRGREQDSVDPHHLSAAVHLYRGQLLAGFFLKDSESFEEWLVAEQERLREAALDGLRTLIEVYRRRGEHRLGIHYARRLIAIEPLSEETCRDLMRMCARAGRRSLALAEYERLKGLLAREASAWTPCGRRGTSISRSSSTPPRRRSPCATTPRSALSSRWPAGSSPWPCCAPPGSGCSAARRSSSW